MTTTDTTIETRHDRRITVDHYDDKTVLEIVNTITGRVLGAGLTPGEARQIAAALDPGRAAGGQWTRDDLPRIGTPDPAHDSFVDGVLDTVVHWLNKHHPKPQPYDQGGVRGADSLLYRAVRAERERDAAVARADQLRDERDDAVRERDEWKAGAQEWQVLAKVQRDRAEQAERERYEAGRREVVMKIAFDAASERADKAEDQWKKWEHKAGQRDELLIQAEAERDAAVARAEAHARGATRAATRANLDRDKTYSELVEMTNRAEKAEEQWKKWEYKAGEWKARAEAAEARTAPAVTCEHRDAVADHLWNAMVGSAKSVVRDVVAQAFAAAGIEVAVEAEAAVDPVEPEGDVIVRDASGHMWWVTDDGWTNGSSRLDHDWSDVPKPIRSVYRVEQEESSDE